MAAIVCVEQGKLRGRTSFDYNGGTFYSFQGIPYAKPPVGELRFKAPLPADPWHDIKDATEEASESLSRHFIFQDKIVGSEDCLFLNVYTPNLPGNGNNNLKPVMFWIHGGGFTMGSSKTDMYGPEFLITGDVVLVTTNYRLGILGFLSLEDPKLGIPGNAGLKDIVMSLKWVQSNIENFGGDPNNITIFGESAGSAAVHCLILSPMGKGLFHRAILQSGCVLNPWVFGGRNASKVAKVLGFENQDEESILQFLRTVSPQQILEAQDKIKDPFRCDQIRPFGVVVERNATEPMFFSEHPLAIMKSGNYNKMPIIIGYTSREGMLAEIAHLKLFGKLKVNDNFEERIPYFYNVTKGTDLSLKIANKIKQAYHGSAIPSAEDFDAFYKLETDVMFLRGIYKTIQTHFNSINHPIYFYVLSADTSLNVVKRLLGINKPGACHADDLGYLFKMQVGPEISQKSVEDLMIRRMVKLWTNFARYGNPNSIETDALFNVTWKPIEKNCFKSLDINTTLSFMLNSDLERMKVWDEISSLLINAKL